MAHVALVIDDDPVRRGSFTGRVCGLFGGLEASVSTATLGLAFWCDRPAVRRRPRATGSPPGPLSGTITDGDAWIRRAS